MQTTPYRHITESDLNRLRGDTVRVGQDFYNVIRRENKKNTPQQSTRTKN